MARVAFFGMIKCCDPEQYTVLNLHIIVAACFESTNQFQCPSAGRPAAKAVHVVWPCFEPVGYDDTRDYGAGRQGGIC